jgi:CNT family concentrative nucleoside transporter
MYELLPHEGFIFALRVLPQVIYVSALLSILYYLGVMQVFARLVGKVLQFALKVKEVEAFAAVMTIFLGMVEMPVAIRPYLSSMSSDELFTIMASGTASIAGSVLMAYTGLGIRLDYLLAASCMAIPGGLLFAKLLLPTPDMAPAGAHLMKIERSSANIFEAAATGVMSGARVALSVSAMLIGFIGIVALMNGLISFVGGLAGYPTLSLQGIFGEVLSPLAWLIGVPWNLCREIGGVIGQKAVFNELVAYTSLGPMIRGGGLDPRTIAISTFALCGFANLASIGVLMGAFGSVAPERRTEVAKFGFRAVVAGMLSNLMSGAIAGVFVS